MKRILVIEDDRDCFALIASVLEPEGCRVSQAADAAQGLQAASSAPPDLLLIDVQLPDGNGFELLDKLRAQETLRTVPVLFITGTFTRSEMAARSKGLDRAAYLMKPFAVQDLVQAVRSLLKPER